MQSIPWCSDERGRDFHSGDDTSGFCRNSTVVVRAFEFQCNEFRRNASFIGIHA